MYGDIRKHLGRLHIVTDYSYHWYNKAGRLDKIGQAMEASDIVNSTNRWQYLRPELYVFYDGGV